MQLFGTACLFVLLSVVTNAARTTKYSNPCLTKCSSEDPLFKPGQAYIYSYEGESEINTINGLYDSTGVLIKSKVTITGISKCQMKLSISEVKAFDRTSKDGNNFKESPNSGKVKQILEKNEVFFTRENEKVKSVCMAEDEPAWAENLKKSVIDILANLGDQTEQSKRTMTSHGTCTINNKTTETSSTTNSVKFSYDLITCDNPKKQNNIFKDIAKESLFQVAQVNCKYLYHGKTDLRKIQCKEQYKMIPFKQDSNHIVVEIKTTLTKESQKPSNDRKSPNKNLIQSEIQQNKDEFHEEQSTYSLAKRTLKDICTQKVASVSSEIPKLFMKLINQLKNLDSKEFKKIYLDILKEDICTERQSEIRSLFYDAVGFVSTPAATSVMVDLIKSNHLSAFDQNLWLASLSFMQQMPTIEMLKDLESLISTENPTGPMYLGISVVTHLYCQHNPQSCLSDPTIKSIISKFLKNLNNDCSQPNDKNKDQLTKILISLKALGNLKFFSDEVTDVLRKCISTKTNPLSIRISALEVMKHMECNKDRSVAMEILENNENDSELRINAYLTMMGCSDSNTLFKVRSILEKEKVNQVGSFIWTHLTNIKETGNYFKRDIRELLENVELKKVFDISKLKFSRNIEKTFKLNRQAITFDSNIMFSEKSFIPRSISLNTTASILNKEVNFMEMSARLEGLEDLLYKLFGPQGYMKKQTSPEDNLALIHILNEMNGNMDIKLYGQQISFIELIRGSLGSVKKYNIIEEMISWTQNKQFEMNKNVQLIDKTAVLPTMLGFPLKLKLQGSVSVNIKIQSKIDIDGLFSWPIAFNIDNHISPNVNAEFDADIMLQTPFSNYGMRLNLKSGTNTELKAKIFASKNEEFSIKIDTPKTKQNIFSIEGKSYVIHRSNEILQFSDKMKQTELCTSKEPITRVLGVRLCGTTKYIDPSLKKNTLLYGPFSANLFIEKQDTQTGYIIRGSSKSVPFISEYGQQLTNRFIKFELDTPNSMYYDRRFFGEFVLDFNEKHVKFELSTPWNQLLMMTTFKVTEAEKKIRLNLQLDKKDIVDIMAEHVSVTSPKGNTIRCGFTASIMKFTPIRTKYSFISSDTNWVFDFHSTGMMKDDARMKVNIKKVKSTRELSLFNNYEVSGSYSSYFGNGEISGIASENYYSHRWDVKLKHKPRDKTQNEFIFIFRHKTEDKSSKNLNKYLLMTTFAYGKKAENILKLKLENELSDKHVRASLKINSGKDVVSIDEIVDLQLYGGYRWKEDNRHYAEGSLSIKLPTKNLNYEGRYNSEVGKNMFKLSLALDKDQQSKVNLKINYLQPVLYLKNTDCEVTFSIPNRNIDIKWNLMEIDVHKYKYSLETKYNNYNMKIHGVQTQISRFNHDSSLKIELPKIGSLPKEMHINLKIDLVDIAKAIILGKVSIPNSNHQYGFETKFSYTPQNLLQISTTDINSVLKYDIEISSLKRKIKSKFIFTCNPEEFQTYLNLDLNAVKDSINQIEFDLHSSHKTPTYKQFNNLARVSLRYPGNYHSMGFKSEFKYTEMIAQIDLTWNKDQRISINTMYEIDNSWTQKGLTSSLTIKTPFKGFEQTHFGINAVGQLRYRKIDFECKWGSNKKILFDIVIHPKSSNDFTLTWKLITPFKGWNLLSFNAKHSHTSNSINTQASLEIGPSRRYQIKFEGINNSEGKNRDFVAHMVVDSGFYPSFKMSILHKDDSVHFKSHLDVLWMKTESLNIKSEVSYTLEDSELITKGNIELFSTLTNVKQMKAIWSIDNRNGQFLNNIELLHNSKQIFESSLKGFYESEPGIFKMEFNGKASAFNRRTLKIANSLNFQDVYDFQHRFSISEETITLYSHNFATKKDSMKLKFLIPSTEFKTVEIEWNEKKLHNTQKIIVFFKIGEKYLFKMDQYFTIKTTVDNNFDINFKSKFYSDFIEMKEIYHGGILVMDRDSIKYHSTTSDESATLCKISAEVEYGNRNQKLHIAIKSKYDLVNFNLNSERIQKGNQNIVNFLLKFNGFTSKIEFDDLQQIDIDINGKYRGIYKYFKLKHSYNQQTFEHLFDTNIFGKTIRSSCSIQSRKGLVVQYKYNGNFRFLRSFEMMARITRDGDISLVYETLTDARHNNRLKINYSIVKGLHRFTIEWPSYFQSELKLDLKQFKTILLNIKHAQMADKPNIQIYFNYEVGKDPMKHSNEFKLNIGSYELELKNKVENVHWKYLLIKSEMKTNFKHWKNYKIGFEYQLKPSKFIMNLDTIFNEHSVKLKTILDSSSTPKFELKVETSFPILKEISFEWSQKQNHLYTQIAHKCKAVVQSNESVFKFQNTFEWSGINYLKIDLSIYGKLSENSFIIRPKSLKFVHKFYKQVLTEDFQILYSEDRHLQVKLHVPLYKKSKSSFVLESSFPKLKKLSVDFDIDFSEIGEKSISLRLQRNNENRWSWQSKYKKQNKLFFLSTDLEISDTYKTGLEIEFKEIIHGTLIFKGKFFNPLLKESIALAANYNPPKKDLSISLTGAVEQKFSINFKISNDKYNFNAKYGKKTFHFEIESNKKEGFKHIKLISSTVININLELLRSFMLYKISGEYDGNSLKIIYRRKGELDFNFDILKTKFGVNMKRTATLKKQSYVIKGKSNIIRWSQFETKLEMSANSESYKIDAIFLKESRPMININMENKYFRSLAIIYSSIFDYSKSGKFKINYQHFPKNLELALTIDSFGTEFVKADFKIDGPKCSGKLKSQFEWFREITFEGEWTTQKNEVKGMIIIKHNKLKSPIKGEIQFRMGSNILKIKLKTPFKQPYDEVSFTREMSIDKYIIMISNKNEELLSYKFIKASNLKFQVDLNVMVPPKDITFSLSSNVDMESITKFLKLKLKSNLFEEFNAEITSKKNEYQIKFSFPSKEGQIQLKISPFQSSGKQINILTQYGESNHAIELAYEIQSAKDVYVKAVVKSSTFLSSSTGLEAFYKHKFALPNTFNLEAQCKFNDKVSLYKSIIWQRQSYNSFEFSSTTIFSPNDKEFESKIELSVKRGEIFDLILSLSEFLKKPIHLQIVTKPFNFGVSLQTPFQYAKSLNFNVHTESKRSTLSQTFTFESNILGKYEMLTEYESLSNGESQITSQINTPSANKKIYTKVTLKNQWNHKSINGQIEFDGKTYNIYFARQDQQIHMKLDSQFEYLKRFEMIIATKTDLYETNIFYNQHEAKLMIKKSEESLDIKIESNTPYFKVASMSIERSRKTESQISINVKLMKDEKYFQFNTYIKRENSLWKYSSKNDLFAFLPKSFGGQVQLSFDPFDLAIELRSNDIPFFQIVLNEDQVLFNSQLNIYKTSITELKFSASIRKIEIIILGNKLFSILITRTTPDQIDATLITFDNQYSMSTIFTNNDDKLLFKLSTYKNQVDKLLEINNEIGKRNQFIQIDVTYLSKSIFKLKLTNKYSPMRIISVDAQMFSIGGAADFLLDRKWDVTNLKFSWNFLFFGQQSQVGSIVYVWKSSWPLNYLISVNLHEMAFQAQFMDLDNGQVHFKLSTPFKGLDIDLKWLVIYEADLYKLWCSLENSFTGEYSVKSTMRLNKDPEIKFLLSSTTPIINYKFKLTTSGENQQSFNTELQLFNWEKIDLKGKFSTKDLIELVVALNTPFAVARNIEIEKTIKFNSIYEHTYHTKIIYNGFMKIKYSGKHEIHWEKKIFKFQNSFYNEDLRIISLDIDHFGTHDQLEHSFIWHFKENKFGLKLNGGFKPLFEGKSEIFTPFHQAGKLVLMGKQMENGILIEAGRNNGEMASFEYMKKEDISLIKVIPPQEYGKPLTVKYQSKRFKREAGSNEIESEITYGTDELIKLISKIQMDKDKYSANLNIAAPFLSKKSMEISLNHKFNENAFDFDHKVTLKDAIHNVYRLFGKVFSENSKHFKIDLNSEHPRYGPMHLSLGHSLTDNSYKNELLLKSGDDTVMMHKGNIQFDSDKPSFTADLNTNINSHHHRLTASHSGDWKSFLQSLLMEYNNMPYLRYKSQVIPQGLSNIEIEFPRFDVSQIRIDLDNNEKKIQFTIKMKFIKHMIEIINKNGNLQISHKADDKVISSLSIGYATEPLSIKGSHLAHSLNIIMAVENGFVTLKMTSTFTKLKEALLKISKNTIMTEVNYNGKPYTVKAEYDYKSDKVYATLETSFKQIGKMEFYASPTEAKFVFNHFVQTLQYLIMRNHIQLIGKSNVKFLQTFSFDMKLETPTKGILKMELNSFKTESKIEYSENKLIVESENNYFDIHSAKFEVFRTLGKDLQHCAMVLFTNKIERLKIQFEIKNQHYSLGLDTYLGHHFVLSYNLPSQEMIVSLKSKDRYLNIINKIRKISEKDSKTVTLETNIDSSWIYLQKLNNEFSYAITDSVCQFKLSTKYNSRAMVLIGEISKSKIHIYLNNDEKVFSGTILIKSANDVNLIMIIPGHKMTTRIRNEKGQFSGNVVLNKREILNVKIKQNSFEHESTILYHGVMIWSLNLNTDFRKYEMKMSAPTKIEVTILNDWKDKEITTSFFVKYGVYQKPYEIGGGIKFQRSNHLGSCEIHIENSYHLLSWKHMMDATNGQQLIARLLNKETKHHWQTKVQWIKERMFLIQWTTPKITREIRYTQTIENNVKTLIDLDILGFFKYNLKSEKNSPNQWTGSLTLFTAKIASVEMGKDYVKATFNEAGPENERIYFKWTTLSRGEWKKDYLLTEQLVLIQKSLNINLDISHKTRMESKIYSTFTTINHQLMNGSMRTLKFGASVDFRKSDKIIFELENPIFPIKTVLHRSQPDKTSLRYGMETVFEGDKKIEGFLQLSTGSNPGMTMKLYYNPEDRSEFAQIHSKYIDDRQMEMYIFTEKNSLKTTYLRLLLRLLNEHHIETTFELKTNMLSKLSATIHQYRDALIWKIISVNMHRTESIDINKRYEQIMRVIPRMKQIVNDMETLYNQISFEIISFQKEISSMKIKNEFYFNTLSTALSDTLDYGMWIANKIVLKVILFTEQLQRVTIRYIRTIVNISAKFYKAIFQKIRDLISPIMWKVIHYASLICDIFQINFINSLEKIRHSLQRQFEKVFEMIIEMKRLAKLLILNHASKLLERTIAVIKYIAERFRSGSFNFLKDEKEINIAFNDFINKLEKISKGFAPIIQTMTTQADKNLYFLTGEKYFQDLGKAFSSMIEFAINELRDTRFKSMVKNQIYSVITDSFDEIQSDLEKIQINLYRPYIPYFDHTKIQRIDNDNDLKIVMKHTSFIPINDLKSLPDFSYVTRKIQHMKQIFESISRKWNNRASLVNRFLELKGWFAPSFPAWSMPSILPEFENYATISKASVVTFDKQLFQLSSDSCRILLSKDNQFKRWEIILNQRTDGRFYYINIGTNVIDISGTDYKVYLNGKPAELPLIIGSTSLVGLGRVIKLKDNNLGLTVTVDPMNDIFTVGISGWYHAKVRGLLGNSDNEPFNDLMLDDGKIVSTEIFTKSYNYKGQSCNFIKKKEQKIKVTKNCPFLRRVACKFLFECPFSPMAACFNTIDPKNFLHMCINTDEPLLGTLDPHVCMSARQYQTHCSQAGVKISLPQPCQKCDVKNDKPLLINGFRNVMIKDTASDIIFIVDEGTCLNSLKPKLPKIIFALDKEMRGKGITSVQFGLVTFVDDYIDHASFHTVGQKMLGSSDDLIRALQTLKPSNGKFKDVTGAITLAYNYPFREHASRHIVMISCSTLTELGVKPETISDKLQQKTIHFSLLTDLTISLKGSNMKTTILGVDSTNVYTAMSRTVDKNITARPEKDVLYKLAMKLKGVVFDYKYLTVNRPLTEKLFINTFVNQISQRATPARSSRCTCVADGEFSCVPLDLHTIFPVTKVT